LKLSESKVKNNQIGFCCVIIKESVFLQKFELQKMELLKVILLAVGLFGLGMLGMTIKMLLKKGGKFPNTHVSGNAHLRKQGVQCWQTQDKLAQKKAWEKVKFEKVSFTPEVEPGK
jgi:hypothetical protein